MLPYVLAAIGGYLVGDATRNKFNPLSNPYNILKDGGEVVTWRIMYFRAIPTRGGDKMVVMEDQDIITGSLDSVAETAKSELVTQGYEYAQIVDQKGKALGKKVTK